ncbi:hypothetical protein [Companilactobacillus sp. HBUAS59699]|uniref:hypothetical protein n=1 Tax=Companilactobacillus sp. HBUAS59699 TaxID=3109358 RepID=UPI002FEF10E2
MLNVEVIGGNIIKILVNLSWLWIILMLVGNLHVFTDMFWGPMNILNTGVVLSLCLTFAIAFSTTMLGFLNYLLEEK